MFEILLQPLDRYCERVDPSVTAEPLNFFSNFLYILMFYLLTRRTSELKDELTVKILRTLILMIGIGSASFHSFASPLTLFLDVLFIALFTLSYIGFLFGRIYNYSVKNISLVYLIYIGLTIFCAIFFRSVTWTNGSGQYFPIVLFLIWISIHDKSIYFFYTTLLFILALTFRTLDEQFCHIFPLGIHFIWHTLSSIVLYRLYIYYEVNLAHKSTNEV